jgi:hypothetical protein
MMLRIMSRLMFELIYISVLKMMKSLSVPYWMLELAWPPFYKAAPAVKTVKITEAVCIAIARKW